MRKSAVLWEKMLHYWKRCCIMGLSAVLWGNLVLHYGKSALLWERCCTMGKG